MISSCMVIMRLAVQGAQGRGVGTGTALVLSLGALFSWGKGKQGGGIGLIR